MASSTLKNLKLTLLSVSMMAGEVCLSADNKLECTEPMTTDCYVVCSTHNNQIERDFYYLDEATYLGWLTFNTYCSACHGQDGTGPKGENSSPQKCKPRNLTIVVKTLGFARFEQILEEGIKSECTEQWHLAMPSWNSVAPVRRNYKNVYRYLKARAMDDLPEPGIERHRRLESTEYEKLKCSNNTTKKYNQLPAQEKK
jgi:hypothetical protein